MTASNVSFPITQFTHPLGDLSFDQLNLFVLDVVCRLKTFNVNLGYLVNLS